MSITIHYALIGIKLNLKSSCPSIDGHTCNIVKNAHIDYDTSV